MLVGTAIPFRAPTDTLQELHLYNYDDLNGWWDEIELVQ